jgi:hypothetical protein
VSHLFFSLIIELEFVSLYLDKMDDIKEKWTIYIYSTLSFHPIVPNGKREAETHAMSRELKTAPAPILPVIL